MRDVGVVQSVEIFMKSSNDKQACNKCGERAIFLDRGTWWCSWKQKKGAYNLVGRCKNDKRDRNYAVSND